MSALPPQVADASLPVLTPVERLALSREQLRTAMIDSRPRRKPAAASRPATNAGGTSWLDRLKDMPGVDVAVETVSAWWQSHPLRATALVGGEAARALLRPAAQRNPLALALVSLAVGAVLMRLRPWRWIIRPALFAGLLPQLVTRVVASLPIESWMNVLTKFADAPSGRAARRGETPDHGEGLRD